MHRVRGRDDVSFCVCRCVGTDGGAGANATGKVALGYFRRIAPIREELGAGARAKVGTIRIEVPPFAFNDHPRFVAVTDEFFSGTMLSDTDDGLWSFRKTNRKGLQRIRHSGVADGVGDIEDGIEPVDAGVVDFDGTRLIVDEDVVAHLRAPASVARLHCGTVGIVHENRVVSDDVAVASPERKVVRTFYLAGRGWTGLDVGFVVRILIIPLSDAVVVVPVDQVVLDQGVLKPGKI